MRIIEEVELSGDWPPQAPTGVVTMSWRDEQPWIDHADPRVVFSAQLIDQAAFRLVHPAVTLTLDHCTLGHVGALLKIQAANRQVIYRLTEWLPGIRAYVGEWPE